MDETVNQQQSTNSGVASGLLNVVLRLKDLPHYKLGQTEENAFHASNEKWVAFASTFFNMEGTDVGFWTWEMRRDLLNWMLDEGIIEIEGDRLIPVEEQSNGHEETDAEAGTGTRTDPEAVGAGEC